MKIPIPFRGPQHRLSQPIRENSDMYRKYKGPFRGSGQAIWASDRPLCSRVCAFTRPLF